MEAGQKKAMVRGREANQTNSTAEKMRRENPNQTGFSKQNREAKEEEINQSKGFVGLISSSSSKYLQHRLFSFVHLEHVQHFDIHTLP